MRVVDWCQSIPESAKFILLSAYLASVSPPEADIHHFGGLKQNKRRKLNAGEEQPEPGAVYASRRSNNIVKLERLLSILTTIYSSASKGSGYGQVEEGGD